MSLYGDLPQARTGGDEAAPSGNWATQLLASNSKRPAFSAPSSVLRAPQKTGNLLPRRQQTPKGLPGPAPAAAQSYSLTEGLKDEYDPAKPNDYEEVLRERQAQREAVEQEADRQQQLKKEDEEAQKRQDLINQIHERALAAQKAEEDAGVLQPSIAAPQPLTGDRSSLAISGEEAFLRRGRARQPAAAAAVQEAVQDPAIFGNAQSAAERMMAKMGWQAGQGLGQKGQGMTTPLEHRRSKQGGAAMIVNAEERAAAAAAVHAQKKQKTGVSIRGTPTRVVLLRNMVGPGDVDDDLEDEVGNECSKYGNVQRVVIFEITEENFPPELAVRIFIEFDRIESATKALVDLEGRFFGGRTVRANFYSEQKLDKDEVAPFEGEDD